jgi:hypothetical protein
MTLRRIALGAAVLLALLASGPSHGAWCFGSVYTLEPGPRSVDGRFYGPDGQTLVKDGALAQFVVGIHGAPITDNGSGSIDTPDELAAVRSWVNSGADPAAVSDGANVLASDLVAFTGEFELAGGRLEWACEDDPNWGVPPIIRPGLSTDLIAVRVWNLTKGELADWGAVHGQDIWYTTDREIGSTDRPCYPYSPDLGWCVGQGAFEPGIDILQTGWQFRGTIGVEVALGLRDMNRLDSHLGTATPEPALAPLIGAGLFLLVLRRRK